MGVEENKCNANREVEVEVGKGLDKVASKVETKKKKTMGVTEKNSASGSENKMRMEWMSKRTLRTTSGS